MKDSPQGRPFGLRARVGLVFGAMALLLAGSCGVAWHLTRRMHAEMRRVLEEQREEQLVLELEQALVLAGVRAQAGLESPGEDPPWLEARSILDAILSEAPRDDPSEKEHQSTENALLGRLRGRLEALEHTEERGQLERGLGELMREVHTLRAETEQESREAALALDLEAARTRRMVLAVTLVALGVLAWILLILTRFVVRPILELRREARRLASGASSAHVEPRSHDEIGELTQEFNAMAQEVSRTRGELERRVRERTDQLLRAARLADLGTLAAGIAHEINNPLASIASSAESMERRLADGGVDRAEQREYLQVIAKEAYRAHEIASRLLEFARPQASERTLYDLQGLARELAVLLAHRLRERGLTLAVDCGPTPARMLGNPSECKQVLLNLLQNAIDASPRGGRIELRCRRDETGIVLEVEDEGPGIPPRTWSGSSIPSSPPRRRERAPASAWRSRTASSKTTAARSARRASDAARCSA